MTERAKLHLREKGSSAKEELLGKRHDYQKAGKPSFEATAVSIGFSMAELEHLGKYYPGFSTAKPCKKDDEEE